MCVCVCACWEEYRGTPQKGGKEGGGGLGGCGGEEGWKSRKEKETVRGE